MTRALGWFLGVFCLSALCASGCSSPHRDLGGPSAGEAGVNDSAGASGSAGSPGKAGATSSAGKAGSSNNGDHGGRAGAAPLGDAGAAGATAHGAPAVLSVTPANQTTNVARDTQVAVKFSMPLDAATVTSDSIQILDEQKNPVDGLLTYSANQALFTATATLNLLEEYTVMVSTAVTSDAGTPLEAAFKSTFTIRDGSWTAQDSLGTSTAGLPDYGPLHIVGDGKEHALAVWAQSNGTAHSNDLIAARYTLGSGWSAFTTIATSLVSPNCTKDCFTQFAVDMNASGNAIVAWLQSETSASAGTEDGLNVATRLCLGGTWQTTNHELDSSTGVTFRQILAASISPTGDAHVHWQAGTGTSSLAYAAFADPGGGWHAASQVFFGTSEQKGYSLFSVQLAFAANGDGFALAETNDNSSQRVVVSHFLESAKTWSKPVELDSGYLNGQALALDASGNPSVVWSINGDGDISNVKWSSYNKDWGSPVPVTTKLGVRSLLATPTGFLLALSGGSGTISNLLVSEYTRTGWSTPVIVSDGNNSVTSLKSLIDARGNITLFWAQYDSPYDFQFSRHPADGTNTWSDPVLLEHATDNVSDNEGTDAAVFSDGSMVAGWRLLFSPSKPPFFREFL